MSKNVLLTDSRDIPLLNFLWKWKLSTSAALIRKFFPDCKGKTAYNRLLALRRGGFIRMSADGLGQKFICTLERKGFESIRESLPLLQEVGFKSEHVGHDLLVSAFHLGEWLLEMPETTTLYSEQQLRRVYPDLYPAWVPQSDVHRPDGYTQALFKDRLATFAIEVEISSKRDTDYLRIAEFYSHYRNIVRVLWLVPRQSTARLIQRKMNEVQLDGPSPHDFILLGEFLKQGWHSQIELGPDKGKTLFSILSGSSQEVHRKCTGTSLAITLLDTRKTPYFSEVYRGYQLGDFRD